MDAIPVKVLKPFSCGGRFYSPHVDPFLWVSPELAEELIDRGIASQAKPVAEPAEQPQRAPEGKVDDTPAKTSKRRTGAKRAPRKAKK